MNAAPPTDLTPRFRLPGGRMAVASLREWLMCVPASAWYLGPAAWRMRRAGKKGDHSRQHTLERRWANGVRKLLDIDLSITGLEHINSDERYVVAALHEGFVDAVALFHLPLDLTFVALDELREWRLLGRYLQDTGQITIDPTKPVAASRRLMQGAGTVFDRDESIVLFPQGTIIGIEAAFKPGVAAVAKRHQRPVLPVVVTGTHRVWHHPFSPLLERGQRVRIEVLPPIPADRIDSEARAMERRLKERALATADASPRRFDPIRDGYWDGYCYEIDPMFADLAADVARHRDALARRLDVLSP